MAMSPVEAYPHVLSIPAYIPTEGLPDETGWEHIHVRESPDGADTAQWVGWTFCCVPGPLDKLVTVDNVWNAASSALSSGQRLLVVVLWAKHRTILFETFWTYHFFIGYTSAAGQVMPNDGPVAMGQIPIILQAILLLMGLAITVTVLKEGSGAFSKPITAATTSAALIIGLIIIGTVAVAILVPQLAPRAGVGVGAGPVAVTAGVGGAPPAPPSRGGGRRR